MVWAGRHFYTHAWTAAKQGTADMNTLVAVGTGAAFLYSVVATVAPVPRERRPRQPRPAPVEVVQPSLFPRRKPHPKAVKL